MNVSLNGHGTEFPLSAVPCVVPPYFRRKAWPTRLVGVLLLLVASPIILLLMVLVRLTSAGPGLYRQARTGRNSATFQMYKIRTMYADAESVSGPVWCSPRDSRITPLGKVLRLLHLDELPQLINVARGEMDLVGPRPERPEIVLQLAREIPDYYERLRVLPGVTGLAQINLPPDQSTDCVRKKLVLDCAYIRESTFVLDMRILACTFLRMLGIRHGLAAKWLGLKRSVVLPATGRRSILEALHAWKQSDYEPERSPSVNGQRTDLALVAVGTDSGEAVGASEDQPAPDVSALPTRRPRRR